MHIAAGMGMWKPISTMLFLSAVMSIGILHAQGVRTVAPWLTGPRECNTLWARVGGSVLMETSANTPGECCTKCMSHGGCNAWSYCTRDTCDGAPAGRCTLKAIPNTSYPPLNSKGRDASGSLLSGVISERHHITRGNNFLDTSSPSGDRSICASACSGFSNNDCWIVGPTDNILSEPQEAGVLKYMLRGQIKDVRVSQEPEKSGIVDFVATADMRLAVASLTGVYPILICGSKLCESYCNGRAASWIQSDRDAFKKCVQMRDTDLTLEACMVQQQPILGGHPAPRPNWCMGLDPSPTQWSCNGQVKKLGESVDSYQGCVANGPDLSTKACTEIYGQRQISKLCCPRG